MLERPIITPILRETPSMVPMEESRALIADDLKVTMLHYGPGPGAKIVIEMGKGQLEMEFELLIESFRSPEFLTFANIEADAVKESMNLQSEHKTIHIEFGDSADPLATSRVFSILYECGVISMEDNLEGKRNLGVLIGRDVIVDFALLKAKTANHVHRMSGKVIDTEILKTTLVKILPENYCIGDWALSEAVETYLIETFDKAIEPGMYKGTISQLLMLMAAHSEIIIDTDELQSGQKPGQAREVISDRLTNDILNLYYMEEAEEQAFYHPRSVQLGAIILPKATMGEELTTTPSHGIKKASA